MQTPRHLAIYYGWPSAVHCQRFPHLSPAEIFLQYDVIVWGGDLANPSHPDYENAIALIKLLRNQGVTVFGYVDMGVSTRPHPPTFDELREEVEHWKLMGVAGIFWDDAGHEFAPTLSFTDYQNRMDLLIEYTHEEDLQVFLNIWNPQDIFQSYPRLKGEGDHNFRENIPLGEGDIILAESWLVSNDTFVNPMLWYHRAEQLKMGRQHLNISLACLSTGDDTSDLEERDIFRAAYWAAVMYQCDSFQFTGPQYGAGVSAGANELNQHPMPSVPEHDVFLGSVDWRIDNGGVHIFESKTAHGRIRVTTDGQSQGDGLYLPTSQQP